MHQQPRVGPLQAVALMSCCHRLPNSPQALVLQDSPGDMHALDMYLERVLPQCRDVSVRHVDLVRLLTGQDGCVTHFIVTQSISVCCC